MPGVRIREPEDDSFPGCTMIKSRDLNDREDSLMQSSLSCGH